MPFLAPLIPLIGSGLGAIGSAAIPGLTGGAATALGGGLLGGNVAAGVLGGRKSARTGTFDRTTTRSGTSTRTRTLRPEQEESIGWLRDIASKLLTDPSAGLEPLKVGARGAVNRRYAGAPQSLADKMLTHGQKSGKFGRGMRMMEMGRLGELSALEPEFARMILEQQEQGVGIAERLLSQDFGGTVTTSGTDRSYGTETFPGSMLGSGIGHGVEGLMSLLMINRMLQGSGSGGGPRIV